MITKAEVIMKLEEHSLLPPVSRRDSPQTSKDGEKAINANVKRKSQCELILDALREGPKTNTQLSEISLKYTGRISDLRANGYEITCDQDGTKSTYRLVKPKVKVADPSVWKELYLKNNGWRKDNMGFWTFDGCEYSKTLNAAYDYQKNIKPRIDRYLKLK
jgi:hypothetical protein